MRAVIQRVKSASVQVQDTNNKEAIETGLLVLVAATHTDRESDARYLARKIINLRIMADAQGKMNRTVGDVRGAILVVSQFTLYARTRKGNRPSFIDAAEPEPARALYEEFLRTLAQGNVPVRTGSFGEYMLVSLTNDGPVTIILDSADKDEPRSKAARLQKPSG